MKVKTESTVGHQEDAAWVAGGTSEGIPVGLAWTTSRYRVSHDSLIGQELMYSLVVGCPWKRTVLERGTGVTCVHTAGETGWGTSHITHPYSSSCHCTAPGLGGVISCLLQELLIPRINLTVLLCDQQTKDKKLEPQGSPTLQGDSVPLFCVGQESANRGDIVLIICRDTGPPRPHVNR